LVFDTFRIPRVAARLAVEGNGGGPETGALPDAAPRRALNKNRGN
jgi:hypothetical protein